MFEIIAPIVYFVLLFGSFEVFMFRKGIAYWQYPLVVSLYFGVGTILALEIFSSEPLARVLSTPNEALAILFILYAGLIALSRYGYFTFSGMPVAGRSASVESLRYICGKSFDILFQDTLVIIVALALSAYIGDPWWTLCAFTLYFLIVHSFLTFILPFKFALIFTSASLFAGLTFGSIVILNMPVAYIFIVHWLFYALSYSFIKRVRQEVLPIPVYE